jgi:hypothetical protein
MLNEITGKKLTPVSAFRADEVFAGVSDIVGRSRCRGEKA